MVPIPVDIDDYDKGKLNNNIHNKTDNDIDNDSVNKSLLRVLLRKWMSVNDYSCNDDDDSWPLLSFMTIIVYYDY